MTETPTRLEWPIVRNKIVALMKGIEERVELMASCGWWSYKQEAWIGQHGADIVVALEALLERNAELEAMLRRLEWASNRYQFDYETITICPVCHATEFMNSRGHRDGCELAALLPEEAL